MASVQYCPHCGDSYRFKELFEKHLLRCEPTYRNRKERIKETETLVQNSVVLTTRDLSIIVRTLLHENRVFHDEITALKATLNFRRRKTFVDTLLSASVPTTHFSAWIQAFVVTPRHLEQVFQYTLLDGIKSCLEDRIHREGGDATPLRAFPDKPTILYLYDHGSDSESVPDSGGNKWRLVTCEDFERMIDKIVYRLMGAFCDWEEEHEEQILSSESFGETYNAYSRKMNARALKKTELKPWLTQRVLVK